MCSSTLGVMAISSKDSTHSLSRSSGAGALLFLTTGQCTKIVGIASGLSLILAFLVLTNWSASKCACRVIWVYCPHTILCCLATYYPYPIVFQCTVFGNTLYIVKRQPRT